MHAIALGVALVSTGQETPNPYRLSIGDPRPLTIAPSETRDTASGKTTTAEGIARAARGHRFVYLGESHDNALHHRMQAAVIEALVADGRNVIVGFEMFTRPVQDRMNPWTLGWWSEEEFIANAEWKTQWGFDFALYRPIFEATRKHRLPMVALNVPRDWVRAVGRDGQSALTPEQRAELPKDMSLDNQAHRAVFGALMGGHPPTGPRGESIYAAQVLWDEGMADSALKYLAQYPNDPNRVMVIVAGSGHVMYGQGINYRVWMRTGEKGVTLTMIASDKPTEVSRGLGDFVYCAPGKE